MKENSKSVSNWVQKYSSSLSDGTRWDSVGVNARRAICKETGLPLRFPKMSKE